MMMADTSLPLRPAPGSTADTTSQRHRDGTVTARGGSAGRGRGGGSNSQQGGNLRTGGPNAEAGTGGNRGRGRGKGRGNGRGGPRGPTHQTATSDSQNNPVSSQPGASGGFGGRLTKDLAAKANGDNQTQATQKEAEEEDEGEVCFICASPVAHHSVAPCNHRTCHICALRLRALYKTKACAHCRTEAANVIFTDEPDKRYEDYVTTDFFRTDDNLGISYEKPEIFEDTVLLLRYNCPDGDCDVACLGWPDLHRHVRTVHHKSMCDLCTRNKKVFTHEHELFTKEELRRHEKFGDDNPGAVDQSGFKGHPECGFCRQRFYGDDELYAHCREKHERCHLCDRRSDGRNPQYFVNYDALEQHFSKAHFPCYDKECQEKKFVVFDSEMDLKAHQLESHPNGLSKDARRDARRVDMAAFDYRPVYQEPRPGRRGGGRGRDPNAEQMPPSSTAHMSRAEIAHQREREIHGTQAQTSRSFGGQLSRPEPSNAPSTTARAPNTTRPPVSSEPPNAAGPTSPRLAEALTPQEQARRLRHAAVTERAAGLLKNDANRLEEFRSRISAYRQSNISAGDLIDGFFALFDAPSDELGKLVKELADIFENASKRENLLKAWSNWKAINEDYPSLPGPSGASSSTATGVLGKGVGTSRVLRLKNSTAQSSRSAVSRHGSWGTATASTPANPFPSLPPPRGKSNAAPGSTPSWLSRPSASASGGASSAGSSARPSPVPTRAPSAANLRNQELFPALPAAAKPTTTLFSPGARGAGVIRNHSNVTIVNAWNGAAAADGANGSGGDGSADGAAGSGGKRKGNKGKKQVLIW